MTDELKIHLPHYEGPLDLLLDMIRRQKIDIYDIPIAQITEQYLSYLRLMNDMNVDLASDFLVMAAQLIYIKSRMLLPPDPDVPEEQIEDPRADLVRRLVEYEKFRNAAQMLYQREMIENAVWSNPGSLPLDEVDLEPEMAVSLYDLLLAFRDVIQRSEEKQLMQVDREEFSVEQMMGFLWERISAAGGEVMLSQILPRTPGRKNLISAFLGLLELTRLRAIFLRQEKPFGEIVARANPHYELSKSVSPA
jgi:segregation and condensation protein A